MSKELEALNKIQHDFGQLKGQELVSCYETIFNALQRLEAIDNATPSEALECLEKLKGIEISSMPFKDDYGIEEVDLNDIRKVGSQLNTDFKEYIDTIKQALLNAEKYEKIILGIEDYLNRRIKVEPLEDVRKAFIEIRNQLQVIKEVLEWFLKCDHW